MAAISVLIVNEYAFTLPSEIIIKFISWCLVWLQYLSWLPMNMPSEVANLLWKKLGKHEGYGSRFVCVCVCVCVCVHVCVYVCYHASCYIPHLYVENKVLLSFPCPFLLIYCVDFVENTLFESSGDICWPPLPSSLLDQLLTDKRQRCKKTSV